MVKIQVTCEHGAESTFFSQENDAFFQGGASGFVKIVEENIFIERIEF